MKPNPRFYGILICLLLSSSILFSQTTSWRGTTNTNWNNAANWTNGIPTATIEAILGDVNFTGVNQPTVNATASCKTLTVGGTVATTFTLTKNLSVAGSITINPNGNVIHPASTMALTGAWTNNGTYNPTTTSSSVIFSGTIQSINGTVITTFRKLTINSSSVVTLNTNVNCTGTSSLLSISGTLNPNESPTYLVTAENITVNSSGVLKINAPTFVQNYLASTAVTLNSGSIVEYAATTANQVISNSHTYSTLRISGAGTTKSLTEDLLPLRSTSSSVGNLYVLSGTLDLAGFAIARGVTVVGGTLSVSNAAVLRIGATAGFPAGYGTNTMGLTSTVEYYGGDQPVSAKTYGNLVLKSAAGSVTKTMPATAFTVAGSLTSDIGAGTGVTYAAAANITVTGSVNIGAGTTFTANTFTIAVTGNWNNNGVFNAGSSTLSLKGANTQITGASTQSFFNVTITGSNITAPALTDVTVAGNLATSGSGTITLTPSSVLRMTGTTKTITGAGITFGNLNVSGVVTTTASFIVAGNITCSNSFIASAGIITMNGISKSITNTSTLTFRGLLVSGIVTTSSNFTVSSSLNCSGTITASAGTVTFSSTSTLTGTVGLFNVTINGSSLALSANAVMGVAGAFTITAGSFNVTSYVPNTVDYNGSGAQTVRNTTYNRLVLSNGGTKTAAGAITTNSSLTISPAVTFDAGSFTHTMVGNWINNGSFIPNLGTIQFTGATNGSISGATTFNIITVNKSLATYTVSLLDNVSVFTINMTAGTMNTGSNTLTITNTRNGNAFILGTITRTHLFLPTIAYAFEGPNNTITFASMTGVTSVTVNVTVAPVTDFPFSGAIGRTYTVTVPAGTYNATLRLHYEDAELNGNDEANMQLWKYNGASWAVSGKTGNNVTTNYVEKNAITSLNGRWTMTDDGSVLSWNGSVSSDWSVAANWTLVQGTFSGAPTATDIAQVGVHAFTNQPIITTAASVKSLVFGSVQTVNLSLSTGGSLIANGGISGTWSANATHSINVNGQTITLNGDLLLSDNTANHAINLIIGIGSVTVGGALLQSGNASVNFTGAGTLSIGKDYIYTNGTFNAGAGLVRYTGTASQAVAPVAYNNLTIVKTAGTIASLTNSASLTGSLIVTTGEFDLAAPITIAGSVTVSTTAVLDANASNITVGGSWSKSATGTFNAATSTVIFNGTGTQTISAGAFNILTINKSLGTAVLSGNNTVNGNLSLLSGTLNLSTFTLNQSSAGNIFTIADGTTLQLGGTNNFPTGFTTYSVAANSLVHYNGTVAQTVADLTYGNISFSNGASLEKTLNGSLQVNGNLTINSGATLNASIHAITLLGNWVNTGGTLAPGTSDVLFNGIGKTITGNTTFFDVTINGTYVVANSDLTFNGHFQVTPGGDYTAGSGVATLNGDFTNAGSVLSSGTTTFTGTTLQTIRLVNALQSTSTGIVNFNGNTSPVLNSTSTPIFATLNINNTAGVNPSVNWIVLGNFNVSNGATYNGGVYTHTFSRDFINNGTISSAGTLLLNPAVPATMRMAGNAFNSTGTLVLGGTGLITIEGTPTLLTDVRIANTNAAGITTPNGWTIAGDLTINSDAIFNPGAFTYSIAGNIESDGTLQGGSSTFVMTGANTELTASSFTTFNHFTVTGSITPQTDFRVARNFTNNGTYDGSIGVLIMNGANDGIIGGTTTPLAIAQLTIEKTGVAMVTQNVNLSNVQFLNINTGILFTSTRTITQDPGGGILVINNGATLRVGGTNSIPAFTGYNLGITSNVDYAGGAQIIGNAVDYGNLIISGAGTKSAFVPFVVRSNLSVSDGTIATSTVSLSHTIAGNFIMTGGALTGTASTYIMNGNTDQTLQVLSPLINFTVNKASGVVQLGSAVTINQVLTFTAGKIALANFDLTLAPTGSIVNANATRYVIANGNGSLVQRIANGSNKSYPVGSVTNYLPATVTLSAASTSDFIGVRLFAGVYQNGTSGTQFMTGVVNNSWVLSEQVAGGSVATVALQWPAALELPAFSRYACRMYHYTLAGWEAGVVDISSTGSDPYTLTRGGFTDFSIFAAGTIIALPVTWLETNGRHLNGNNHIYWGTANEFNNEYFSIEMSRNGTDYSEIARVNGQLTTSIEQHYEYVHTNVGPGVFYYRIKQVDLDGRFTYSRIIKIVVTAREVVINKLFPIPATDQVTIELVGKRNGQVSVALENVNGQRLQTIPVTLNTGSTMVNVPLINLAAGIYFIKVSNERELIGVERVVKR